MNISSLTLIITEDCNFNCIYCYQKKVKKYMPESSLKKALNFFLPLLTDKYHLNFYGGEPLLHFNLIKKALPILAYLNEKYRKKGCYSLTTNASLITHEIIQFLNKYKFSVEISFDGLVQDLQRKIDSSKEVLNNINKILKYPDISIEVNSVFTPNSINYLTESIKYLINLGIPNIRFSLDTITEWNQHSLLRLEDEIAKLREVVLKHYKKHQALPVTNFRDKLKKGIFCCTAGNDRLAVTPNGEIWGCFLFPDYFKGKANSPDFKKFFFGYLDDFIKNHRRIYPKISFSYSQFSMKNFSTSKRTCLFCSYLENCRVCPVNAAFSGSPLGQIPDYLCKIKRIQIKEKKKFLKEIQVIQS